MCYSASRVCFGASDLHPRPHLCGHRRFQCYLGVQGIIVFLLEKLAKPDEEQMPDCFKFTLDNDAIHAFDQAHPPPGLEPVPFFVQVGYDVLLFFVDRVFEGKAIERFWFLETVRSSSCPLSFLRHCPTVISSSQAFQENCCADCVFVSW